MTRDEVLAKLRAHEAELRGAGIAALWLFGSVARGEAREDSDVDLFFERAEGRAFTIFDRMIAAERLGTLLGRPIDLGRLASMFPGMRERVRSEAIQVF